uniref:Uncharacterized protein n=1 Tax=Arundo donax TaxID=35708 RepID=A0A0A9ENY4_ARUDO
MPRFEYSMQISSCLRLHKTCTDLDTYFRYTLQGKL